MKTDWAYIRRNKFSDERPAGWPEGVQAVSIKGLALLGVHTNTGALYWDGEQVVTRNVVRLGTIELWFTGMIAVGTLGLFILQAGKIVGLWQ